MKTAVTDEKMINLVLMPLLGQFFRQINYVHENFWVGAKRWATER